MSPEGRRRATLLMTRAAASIAAILTVLLPIEIALVATAPGASAASCWGDYCSGQDPQASGCAAGAYAIANSVDIDWNLQLMWSPTCKTEWARVNSDWSIGYLKAVQPSTGYTQARTFTSGGYTWSSQIYSPYRCVYAEVYHESWRIWRTSCV